jgi:hypothetical protein
MSLEESIRKYEDKTKETVEVKPDMAVKVVGDNFMIWKLALRDGVPFFWIDQMYGQMVNFAEFIREVCEAADITTIITATTRNPRAHCRKWKMTEIEDYNYMHEDRYYHVLKGNIDNLK